MEKSGEIKVMGVFTKKRWELGCQIQTTESR